MNHKLAYKEIGNQGLVSTWEPSDWSPNPNLEVPNYWDKILDIDLGITAIEKVVDFSKTSHGSNFQSLFLIYKSSKLELRKEELYLDAVRNLIKKSKYLNLHIELIEGQISEEEFDQEIEDNSDSFTISVNPMKSHDDLRIVSEIIQKLDIEFTEDEVEDLFGISLTNL